MYWKRLIIPAIVCTLSITLLNSCGKKDKVSATDVRKAPPPPKVNAFVIKQTELTERLELPGTLIANEAAEIRPEVSGRLSYLNTSEGKFVGKGTLIAKIYDGDLKAQLNKLAIQLKVQQQTAKRYEELLKIDGVSRQEYDMLMLESSNIKADMAIVQSNIRRTEIRAPFSGTLGLKMVSPGSYVSPTTVLTTIRQNTDLKLDFTLPEKYSAMMRGSQTVNFTSEGNPKVYAAKVIATEAGISEENRSLNVRAMVSNADKQLLPGAFAKVIIEFEPDSNALMVPSQAIIPQARGKKVAVYRGGEVSMEDVTTGIRDSNRVQILSGLNVGDTIITTGLMQLKPKSKVTLTKVS